MDAASALDKDAFDRGNSVYFPRRVIPMLPEKLSNGLCSLNPQVERLAMVADMAISATGEIKNYRFYPAVIWSHARLTYTKVAAALYEQDPAVRAELSALLPHLETLDKLFRVLLTARAKRGAIDFETTETRMIFDDNGKIAQIVAETRNDAHRLIEECMLAANVCASDFLPRASTPRCTASTTALPRTSSPSCASSSRSSASAWVVATSRARATSPSCSSRSRTVPTPSCCRP